LLWLLPEDRREDALSPPLLPPLLLLLGLLLAMGRGFSLRFLGFFLRGNAGSGTPEGVVVTGVLRADDAALLGAAAAAA